MTRRPIAVAILLAGILGCTGKQGYEAVRSAGESSARCERELTVAAQRDCEEQYETSYREYQEDRQKTMSEAATDHDAESP